MEDAEDMGTLYYVILGVVAVGLIAVLIYVRKKQG
jgi:LPXTG-motif cell wall-anchored protein